MAAYQKGLAIAPNNHDLVNEVLATHMNLKTFDELVAFADRFLATDADSDDQVRSRT